MVFNKYYDRSLLLMLLGDKDNNEMIINFLKFMPEEMHKYICKSISLNSHLTIANELRTINFDDMHMLTNDGCMYILKCSLAHGMLIIKLNRKHIGTNTEEEIELSLFPLRMYNLDDNPVIGSFRYNFYNLDIFGNDEERKIVYSKRYNVKKFLFDNLLVTAEYKGPRKIVSVDSCNESISLESLFNDDRFNKFSKKKKLINKRRGYRR